MFFCILHIWQNSIEYLNIETYLNFVSHSKLETLSSLNLEILVKKSPSIVEKLNFPVGHFILSHPVPWREYNGMASSLCQGNWMSRAQKLDLQLHSAIQMTTLTRSHSTRNCDASS